MNKKNRTRVFALMQGNNVFIGCSAAIKLSAVAYSHCRGEHRETKRHFDKDRNRPDLFVLEEVENVSQVTYRRLLAWIHLFEEEGYKVLNEEDMLKNSRKLHPETHQIFDHICEIPLALHLQAGFCTKYTDRDYSQKNQKPQKKSTPSKNIYAANKNLSVRLNKMEMDQIRFFANCLNLPIQDALVYAINRIMVFDDIAMADEQEMYSFRQKYLQTVDNLKKKVSSLNEQIDVQRQRSSEETKKYKKQVDTIKTGIQKYLTYLEPDEAIPLRIEHARYRNYIRNTEINYTYPHEEGFAVIRPHAILWGSINTVRFLVGVTDQGNNIKLRYYPSNHFVGIFPGNDQFGLRGSCWLLGWERKEENVMQLIFSLPLSVHQKFDSPMAVGTDFGKLMWELDHEDFDEF